MARKYEGLGVGIDLGTAYSCVAVWLEQNSRVEIIHNDQGNKITPSCVAFTEYQRFIGDAAKNQAVANSQNTVFDAKRLIGRKFGDPIVQDDVLLWPFKVKAVNALDDYIYKMGNALKKKDINVKLSSQEIEKIESAIAVATSLLDEKNQQVEIDALEDHLKGLESRMEQIIAKTN